MVQSADDMTTCHDRFSTDRPRHVLNQIIAVLAVASVKIHCDYSILACLDSDS